MVVINEHISIHAPHAGRDLFETMGKSLFAYFNPRAPCGARPSKYSTDKTWDKFQSTRPMRGATDYYWPVFANIGISIHAPHAGRDLCSCVTPPSALYFNPRAPCGARRGSLLAADAAF